MQSCETATRGWLSNHDMETLNLQLTPVFRHAIQSMIVEGAHRLAPHLRLTWLSEHFQTVSESMGDGQVSATKAEKQLQSCGNLGPQAPAAAAAADAPPASDDARNIDVSEKRRDDGHVHAVFERQKDLDGGLSKAAPTSAHVSPPSSAECPTDYFKPMSLSAARRDESHMKAVFERHKDVEGGLSKTALMAALRDVDAPVLSTGEGNSEDDVFRRGDSNMSGFVDLNEYVSRRMKPVCNN